MRIIRSSLILLALPLLTLSAQTNDAARTLLGISFGLLPSHTLWDVSNQTINAVSTAGQGAPAFGPDVWELRRELTHSRPTFSVHGTRFVNQHIGYTIEADYYAFQTVDACSVVTHGAGALHPGDPALAGICDSVAKTPQGASGSFAMNVGLIARPFAGASFQPFVEGLAGFASTAGSTVTMSSTYQGSAFPIYSDPGAGNISPTVTVGGGFMMDAVQGMVFRVEARSTMVKQGTVTGASASQGASTPVEHGFQNYFSLLVGVDLVLSKDRGKRY